MVEFAWRLGFLKALLGESSKWRRVPTKNSGSMVYSYPSRFRDANRTHVASEVEFFIGIPVVVAACIVLVIKRRNILKKKKNTGNNSTYLERLSKKWIEKRSQFLHQLRF